MKLEEFKNDPFKRLGATPLGKGNREVWKVECIHDGQVYARKEFRVSKDDGEELYKKIKDEMAITTKSRHHHIVECCGSHFVEKTSMFGLLLRPVADMNLAGFFERIERTKDNERLPDCEILCKWPPCLFQAVNYLHNERIRHKDIKPSNILIKDHRVYLADFGISRDFREGTTSKTGGPPGANTWRYIAPEVDGARPRGRAADIWALGCTVLEICTVASGENSTGDLDGHLRQDGGGWSPPFCQSPYRVFDWILLLLASPGRDLRVGQFIQKLLQLTFLMLDPNPDKRVTAGQLIDLLKHPQSENFDAISQLACDACRHTPSSTTYDTHPYAVFKQTLNGGTYIPSKVDLSTDTPDLWEEVKRRWLQGHT